MNRLSEAIILTRLGFHTVSVVLYPVRLTAMRSLRPIATLTWKSGRDIPHPEACTALGFGSNRCSDLHGNTPIHHKQSTQEVLIEEKVDESFDN